MLEFFLRLFGKTYRPDPAIPNALILQIIVQRLVWIVRGLLRVRSRVFLGPNVRIRGGRQIRFGRFVTIEQDCQLDGFAVNGVQLGHMCKLGSGTVISCTSHLSRFGHGLVIGNNTGFGEYCYFGSAGGIEIGSDVIAGQYVSLHSETHLFSDPNIAIRRQGTIASPIKIGNDIWIGARVTFLGGSEIGDHSVVAAGAVVTGRFPSYSLIGGVPARLIRRLEVPSNEDRSGCL